MCGHNSQQRPGAATSPGSRTFTPVWWLLGDPAALCPPPSLSWGAKRPPGTMSPAWSGNPGRAVPIPTTVSPVRFGCRTPWESGGAAAELEGPGHYLTCFELQTPKKVTPAVMGTPPGGTEPGWTASAGQAQPGNIILPGAHTMPKLGAGVPLPF